MGAGGAGGAGGVGHGWWRAGDEGDTNVRFPTTVSWTLSAQMAGGDSGGGAGWEGWESVVRSVLRDAGAVEGDAKKKNSGGGGNAQAGDI